MSPSKRSKTKSVQEIVPSSQKLDVITNWLQKMLDRFPAKGRITESEIQDWHKDLSAFSIAAIDFAFEKHRTNAIFFPLNAQIIDLCISYEPADSPTVISNVRCDAECKKRHGTGYHWHDMYWLLAKLRAACVVGPETCRKTPLQPGELDALMDELDKKRPGGAPVFRRDQAVSFP